MLLILNPIYRCLICNEYNGIVKKRDKRNHDVVHVHCIIFIKELIEEKNGNGNHCNHNHYRNYSKASNIRKWRMKSQCKLCKEEINESTADKAVIKCTNSKCQSYYHIPCANKLKLLYPIDFQYDFYGVTKDQRGFVYIPFYCVHHNKKIVKEYDGFIAQMEFVLKESQFQPDQHQPCSNSFIDFYDTNSQLSFNEENALSIDFNPWVNNSKLSLSNDTNDLDIDDNRDDISYFEDSLWNLQE